MTLAPIGYKLGCGQKTTDFSTNLQVCSPRPQDLDKELNGPDSHLFDIVEPRHPCAGGLTIEDIQRRLTQYVTSGPSISTSCAVNIT